MAVVLMDCVDWLHSLLGINGDVSAIIYLACAAAYALLLALKADGTVVASYWVVSAPAFFGIATVYYIQLITFVRRHAHRKDTGRIRRLRLGNTAVGIVYNTFLLLFVLLLCLHLEDSLEMSAGAVLSPIFALAVYGLLTPEPERPLRMRLSR